jgi:hypothetical protein
VSGSLKHGLPTGASDGSPLYTAWNQNDPSLAVQGIDGPTTPLTTVSVPRFATSVVQLLFEYTA